MPERVIDLFGEEVPTPPPPRPLPWLIGYNAASGCVYVKDVVHPIVDEATGNVVLAGWEGAERLLTAAQVDELIARLMKEREKCQKSS